MTTENFIKDLKIALAENVELWELSIGAYDKAIFTIHSSLDKARNVIITVYENWQNGVKLIKIKTNMVTVPIETESIECVGIQDKRIYFILENGENVNIYLD